MAKQRVMTWLGLEISINGVTCGCEMVDSASVHTTNAARTQSLIFYLFFWLIYFKQPIERWKCLNPTVRWFWSISWEDCTWLGVSHLCNWLIIGIWLFGVAIIVLSLSVVAVYSVISFCVNRPHVSGMRNFYKTIIIC